MGRTDSELPYFDRLVSELDGQKNHVLSEIFGRNVHWGYWAEPSAATLTTADFRAASDAMTRKLLLRATPAAGQRILDVGCGFGGTVAQLNEDYGGLDLTGLNIDPKQIERAVATVQPQAARGNSIEFVVGNACELPFPDASFDTVLAVECIFHFPSRVTFFKEARRVLRPGGRLVLSDFVVRWWGRLPVYLIYRRFRSDVRAVYGPHTRFVPFSWYRELARRSGRVCAPIDDITRNTLPTYGALRRWAAYSGFDPVSYVKAQSVCEYGSRMGAIAYSILSFTRPSGS